MAAKNAGKFGILEFFVLTLPVRVGFCDFGTAIAH
jgi:hypothetical protein